MKLAYDDSLVRYLYAIFNITYRPIFLACCNLRKELIGRARYLQLLLARSFACIVDY